MKVATLFIAVLLATSVFAATGSSGFEEDDNVIVLKESNFEEAIKKYEFILVEFYAPWCGHCKKLTPEYAAAAKTLKETEPVIPLAKVDATENQALGTKYQVQGYPTLKFFIKGEPIDFNGGRTAAEIVNWIKKKTGPSSTVIADTAALDKVKADNKVVIAYFGAENEQYKNFIKVAQSYDALTFVHSFDASLRAAAGHSLILYKQFDEGHNVYSGDFSTDSIKNFIQEHRYATVMPFEGDEAIERVFGKEAAAIALFTDDKESAAYTAFAAAANSHKGQIIFTHSTVTSGLGQRLSDYVGVKVADAPVVWIIAPKNGELSKFRLTGDITADAIGKFLGDFRANRLERTFKSQEIPEKNDGPVKVVVGKTFNDIVLRPGVHVLVKFYAPWCGHCKTLAPIWEEAASALAGNEKILLVKVDSTENEIQGVNIQGFPTLKFYPANKKDSPIDFSGERTKEGILKFLQENTGEDWTDL